MDDGPSSSCSFRKSKSRERGEQSAMHVAVGVLNFRNQQHKNRGRGQPRETTSSSSRTWMDGEGACDAMRPEEAVLVLVRAPGVWRRGTGEGGRRKAQSSSGTPTRSSADRRRLLGVSVWWDDAGSLQVQACRLFLPKSFDVRLPTFSGPPGAVRQSFAVSSVGQS